MLLMCGPRQGFRHDVGRVLLAINVRQVGEVGIVEEVVEVAVVVGVFKKPSPTLLALVQQFRFLWRDFQRTQKFPKFKSILNL